jgi:hypothetical protein
MPTPRPSGRLGATERQPVACTPLRYLVQHRVAIWGVVRIEIESSATGVSLTFTLSPREYRKLVRGVFFSRRSVQLVLGLVWLAFIFGLYVIVMYGRNRLGSSLLGYSILILCIVVVTVPTIPFVTWRRDRSLRDSRTVVISDRGVTTITSTSESALTWDAVLEAVEGDEFLVYRTAGRYMGVLVPKRAIESGHDLGVIRGIAAARGKVPASV